MHYNNHSSQIKRELLIHILELMKSGRLVEEIDRIPYRMTGSGYSPVRCCVHHDRVIMRYRLLAWLGFSVEDMAEDGAPLSEWAEGALSRETMAGPILTVLDEACNACVRTRFLVTNACQGCLARPCSMNCPRKAVTMLEGHAVIDKETCVNCGICQQVCPYHAIIKLPVPCEEACPVGAVTKNAEGEERIDYTKCVYCGNCIRECPFGAMMERSSIVDVTKRLLAGGKLAALYAPAVAAQFRAPLGKLEAALRRAGFSDVFEVALGADITSAREAAEFGERMTEGTGFMTTSCCPAFVQTVDRHIPALKPRVSSTRSPMHYTAEIAHREAPEACRVFIGPCVAKRKEVQDDPLVDFAISAEELGALFVALDIDVQDMPDETGPRQASGMGRGFAASGGVLGAVRARLSRPEILRGETVNGLNPESMKTLRSYAEGNCLANFVEVMACAGGCLAGPSTLTNPKIAALQLRKIVEGSAF